MSTIGLEHEPPKPKNLLPDFLNACQALDGLVKYVHIGTATRPNGQPYWIARVRLPNNRRHAAATPMLAHLTLDEQAPLLCDKLRELAIAFRARGVL